MPRVSAAFESIARDEWQPAFRAGWRCLKGITTSLGGAADTTRDSIGSASSPSAAWGILGVHAVSAIELKTQEHPMRRLNTTRATWLGAAAAALLATTAGSAVADNAAPTTATQPAQQQTGVTTPAPQPAVTTSVPASSPTAVPTRIWIKRAERGTNTHARGQSH
jgi:hypothetical protein